MYSTISLYISAGNAAERLFAKMKTKDGTSYDVMIQGLVKVLLMFVLTHNHKPILQTYMYVVYYKLFV